MSVWKHLGLLEPRCTALLVISPLVVPRLTQMISPLHRRNLKMPRVICLRIFSVPNVEYPFKLVSVSFSSRLGGILTKLLFGYLLNIQTG